MTRDALSRKAYAEVLRTHLTIIQPQLDALDASMAHAAGDERRRLETKHALIESGLFDPSFYVQMNANMIETGIDPLDHYVNIGDAQGCSPNEVFKPKLYRRRHLAHAPLATNALEHYATTGERQGAAAGPLFRADDYFAKNPSLATFVDRPLFHWLKLGRQLNLVATILPGAQWAQLFDRPLRRSLFELMNFKRALIAAYGIEEGFKQYKEFLALPDTGFLRCKPLRPQAQVARERGVYLEKEQGGVAQQIEPPRVIGTGNHRILHFTSRSSYVARLSDATVRGGSSLIELGDSVLFDYEGRELENFDTEVDFDAAVFAEAAGGEWVIDPPEGAPLLVDQAFSLLGARSIAFGHWVSEHLLRYAEARLNEKLPKMPVLIDEVMPPSHRRSLEVLYPGVQTIVVPAFRTLRISELWFAPTLFFSSIHERRNDRFKWDYLNCSADRTRPALRELGRRADLAIGRDAGPERIFLARRPGGHRQLKNFEEIEALAGRAGFSKVYPESLDFREQLHILRNASLVVAPEGSAVFLGYFLRPGSKMCILSGPYTDSLVGYRPFFDAISVDMTIVAGDLVRKDPDWEEWSDYSIPPTVFKDVIRQMQA